MLPPIPGLAGLKFHVLRTLADALALREALPRVKRAVVLVIDSSPSEVKANQWALDNLRINLKANHFDLDHTPLVLQWNKRDAADAMPTEELDRELNWYKVPTFEAVAFWCCSMSSRKHIHMSGTSSCKCSTTAA